MYEQNEVEDSLHPRTYVGLLGICMGDKEQYTDARVCVCLRVFILDCGRITSAIIRSLPEYEGDIGWDASASCRVGSNFQADKLHRSWKIVAWCNQQNLIYHFLFFSYRPICIIG